MKHFSSIISASLGNILEWYDFGLFSIYSSLFGTIFFPDTNPYLALIATAGIFAIGFLCRPIGALIFGYFGDKHGRSKTLRISMLMIALPTFLIGCLPDYNQIGIAAPIMLTIIRMWQGLSIGGEYSGNLIYLAESAPQNYRATFISLASTGANLGILLATIVGIIMTKLVSHATLEAWGWRLPYLLSGFLCICVYWFRMRMQETPVFLKMKANNQLPINPIKTMFVQDRLPLLRTLGFVCMGSTFYYFCFTYLPIFLNESLHYSIGDVSRLFSWLIALMLFVVPLAGYLCDRIGARRLFLFNSSLIIICCLVGYYYLQQGQYVVLLLTIFAIASSLEQPTTSITAVDYYPTTARYTGLSFGYNLGNGLLGGTVPIICAALAKTVVPSAPGIYIAACAFVSGLVVLLTTSDNTNVAEECSSTPSL